MESLSLRLANQPVVLDNGCGYIRAGFAGGSTPKCSVRCCVGRNKHSRVIPGGALTADFLLGKLAEEHRGALLLSYPMEHGVVNHWENMERLWTHIYDKDNLNTNTKDHAVLLTEAALNPHYNRKQTAEIFFEKFDVPALYIETQAILSLYASGRISGIVLDAGEGVTQCVPVYEGSIYYFIYFIYISYLFYLFHLFYLFNRFNNKKWY